MSGTSGEVRKRSRRAIRRRISAGLGAAGVAVILTSPAFAAQPKHQACLGEDIRTYAEAGAGFGSFVSSLAAGDGAGTEIKAHLSGAVSDNVITNSCND